MSPMLHGFACNQCWHGWFYSDFFLSTTTKRCFDPPSKSKHSRRIITAISKIFVVVRANLFPIDDRNRDQKKEECVHRKQCYLLGFAQ